MKIEQIASRYRIIREIGRGGMGVVYLVEHAHTGEKLALKLLHGTAARDPDVIARFKREARAAAQIRSEHVVRVTDADVAPELGGAPFFAMELLEGLDLEKLVARLGRLRPDVVVSILSQVGRALDRAHAVGIVHRDLKPENLFLHRREDGTPMAKILDFGISKFLASEDARKSSLKVTADGTLMGTPHYMAPEQARGLVDAIGPATDVWAVGLIAVWLLTGEVYWRARTPAELMVEILVAPMPGPSGRWPELGEKFDAWFARSCDREPSRRWCSVSQQVAGLLDALSTREGDLPHQANGASMDSIVNALRVAAIATSQGSSQPTSFPTPGGSTMSVVMPSGEFPFGSPVGLPGERIGVLGGDASGTTAAAGTLARTTSGSWRGRQSRLALLGMASVVAAGLGYRFLHRGPVGAQPVRMEASANLDSIAKAPEPPTTFAGPVNVAEVDAAPVESPALELPIVDTVERPTRLAAPEPSPPTPIKRPPPKPRDRGSRTPGSQPGQQDDLLAP